MLELYRKQMKWVSLSPSLPRARTCVRACVVDHNYNIMLLLKKQTNKKTLAQHRVSSKIKISGMEK